MITGVMSPYAGVVEKLYKDLNKEKVTLLKVERAGDVLADAVSRFLSQLVWISTIQNEPHISF